MQYCLLDSVQMVRTVVELSVRNEQQADNLAKVRLNMNYAVTLGLGDMWV